MKTLPLYLYRIFFCICILIFGNTLQAQHLQFTGSIIDEHTKEPIAYASISFARQGYGKITDSTGSFSFNIANFKTDTLLISYVGYDEYRIVIADTSQISHISIPLQHATAKNDVVVKIKVNKGLFLWKKIMSKKKQYNKQNLTNYSYQAYNKLEVDIKNFNPNKAKKNFLLKPFSFVFDNIDSTSDTEPFLPAYLIETISDFSFQRNTKKYFENIKASKTVGINNESIGKLLGVMNQSVNIYSNYVNVMDKDFISPFNDNADVYYNFFVADTQVVNQQKIFHFVFKSKRIGQNTFEGDAWVKSKTFQIQKINLYLNKEANINYIDRISIFQEFSPINDSLFFLTRDKFFADFKILGKKSLTFIGRKTTSYKDIIINNDSIANLFKSQNTETVLKTNKGGNSLSDSAWGAIRPDTLSKNEKAIYTTINKLLKMPKFQRLQNTLKFLGTGYKTLTNYEIGPWYNWVSSNSWEGARVRFDLGTTTGFNKHIYLHTYLAYGFSDKQLKGKAEAYWILNREPHWLRLHVSYANDIENGINQIGDIGQDNIFSLAIRKPNTTQKFLKLQDTRFEIYKEFDKGISAELFFAHRKLDPLKNLPLKNSFPTPSVGQALTNFEIALKLRFAYDEQFVEGNYFRYSLGTKYPIVEVLVAKAFPNVFNSAYSYTKVTAAIKDNIKISPYGSFQYKIYAGKINGTLPFTFLENHPGNDIYYYNANSFNLMNRFQYISDKYVGINLEHNIGSGIFRFVPLTRKLKWRQFWNVKSVWGSLSDANINLNTSKVNFATLNGSNYMEVGTGVDNIFKILRLDFVWRVVDNSIALNKTAKFGVFGSFQFQF